MVKFSQTAEVKIVEPDGVLLYEYLDTVGDGSGTKNANGNYGAPTLFRIAPPPGVVYRIARMIVSIEDTSGMVADEYGNLGAALSNGVVMRVHDGSKTIIDLTAGLPVKTNAQWGSVCYDVDLKSWGVTPSDDLLIVRWTFTRAGKFITLDGDNNEELQVMLNDNLSGLIAHYFFVQGYRYSK